MLGHVNELEMYGCFEEKQRQTRKQRKKIEYIAFLDVYMVREHASPIAERVKNLPVMQETQETGVWSLGQEDPLEEENSNPLQYFCLKNPTDRGAWQTIHSHRVREEQIFPVWNN